MLRLSQYISPDELKSLCKTSDNVGWYRVFVNYALIYLAFLLVINWFNPLTVILATMIIGARILGIAILNHDAGHGTLFATPALNRWVGKWLLGALVLVDYDSFRLGHAKHHQFAGTSEDPDRLFVQNYPATPASMTRKIARDTLGVNGVKELIFQIKQSSWNKRLPTLIVHSLVLFAFIASGHGGFYLLFWMGYLFAYPLCSRFRIMGEHGAVEDAESQDPRLNTRTTYANWLERLLLAPNSVNYHLEHHIHPNIPAHQLKRAHLLFKKRGMYEQFNCIESSYWQVLKRCTSKSGTSGSSAHAPSSVANLS